MSYLELAYWHLGTILPAFIIGSYLLWQKKGSQQHKALGKIYMLLMLVTALISLAMPSVFEYRVFNHFGFIHLLSLIVLYTVPAAIIAAKKGNIALHKNYMIWLYVGGILIAGSFTFMPGRLLHSWFFA